MNTPVLHGEIETPRPLRAPGGKVLLTGWCVASGLAEAPAVRLVAAAATLPMASRLERSDVPVLLPGEPAAARCGFTVEGRLPPGLHLARFEAELPGIGWQVFKELSLAVEAAPFLAAVDEPISEGTLHDRVKVGGWALDPAQPVRKLSLRYGHREIACRIGLPRPDVGRIFPEVAHAAAAGFVSEDFLVAGHGPVRVKAELADGRTVVTSTHVSFSVATDENHRPELNLTGPRVSLDHLYSRREPPAPVRDPPPLNLLFVLHVSITANSALHVAAYANELAAAGHDCAVAVSHDHDTLRHLERPAFRGLLHAEAPGFRFRDGRGPDIIHAWTCREHVRKTTEAVHRSSGAKVVVHLEDNEQQVLALTVGKSWPQLCSLSEFELDRIVPPDLTHPLHGRGFLERADGVTVIIDQLREFAPDKYPGLTLWPAADERHFFPRPLPNEFRRLLDRAPGETILFYHGNAHAANAEEMRELYIAVLHLNREGNPTTLIRAGRDSVDFLGELASQVAPHVISLGQILHHRHQAPLMALADIFVQPGRPDAFNDYRFPSKLPEFFSVGRPVVLPRTNLGRAVHHGIDAYVLDPADADGIVAAVRALRADPALARRLGEGAVRFAAEHFSWRRSAEALANFYRSLATS